jgi:cell wall-associated NlpC family hydrolase
MRSIEAMTFDLDPRLTPARPDLADIRLRGRVEAQRFVEGRAARIVVPSAPLRRRPDPEAGLETEAVMGDAVTVYDIRDGFAFAQIARDGYVGYLPEAALGPADPAPTHRIAALRSFLYPAPDLKRPHIAHLSLGAAFAAEAREGEYWRLESGRYVFADHAVPLGRTEPDAVAVAERLVGTPYLWGGRTSLGLDCSGLVQLSLESAGLACPRDADQQERALGTALPPGLEGLRRGDLVFWKGHVGMMLDADRLIHANGHHMTVAVEPLTVAVARIAEKSFGAVTSIRRLAATPGA